jgi:hypothetical protein
MTSAMTTHDTRPSHPDAGEPDARRPFVPPVVENLGGLQTATLLTPP